MNSTRRTFLAGAGTVGLATPFAISDSLAETLGKDAIAAPLLLDARTANLRLRPEGPETAVLRFGAAEAPTLRVKRGQDVAVRLNNGLDEASALRWQGVRGVSPAALTIAAAAGASAILPCRFPDSGTYWLRAEPGAANQTERGLSGVLVVEEPLPPPVDQDLVVLLSDWSLDVQNQITLDNKGAASVITVNGRAAPAAWTFRPGSRLRLRFVNGSTRRVMLVACDGARAMILSIDGQPSELFEPTRGTVPMGPGARFDLMLDLPREPDKIVSLTLKGTERVGAAVEPDLPLSTVATSGVPVDARGSIVPLPANPMLPREIRLEQSKRAELVIATVEKPGESPTWTINGIRGADPRAAPILKVKQGDAVTLGFNNTSPAMVPLRVSGQAMRLLHAKDDGWEPYWRDSVLLPPQSRNHVAFVADTPGRYAIESGFDAQLLAGLRCWFEVARA